MDFLFNLSSTLLLFEKKSPSEWVFYVILPSLLCGFLNVFSLLTLMVQVFLDLGLSTTVTALPVSSWFIFLTKE